MKKLVSLMLAAVMLLSLVSFASAAEIAPMTTENITLRYVAKDQDEALVKALADQFMQVYPNITVEVQSIPSGPWWGETYTPALVAWAGAGDMPDVFWVNSVTDAILSGWVRDLNEFYEADPDAKLIDETILKWSRIDGKLFSVPAEVKPLVTVLNKTLFDKYNVALPGYDWTFEEFMELAEELAHPEDYYFGYGANDSFQEYFSTRFGWDGTAFTFDENWVELVELQSEWDTNKISEVMTAEEKTAILGDAGAWTMESGRAAMNVSPIAWAGGYIDGSLAESSGCEFVIYPTPAILDGNSAGTTSADISHAAISSGCEHPREAWELLKWMTWGEEATLLRQKYIRDNGSQEVNVPALTSENVWNDLVTNAPENLKAYYENLPKLRPSIDPTAPGLSVVSAYYYTDVQTKILSGETPVNDMVVVLRDLGTQGTTEWFAKYAELNK